jgi:hypothetical protein
MVSVMQRLARQQKVDDGDQIVAAALLMSSVPRWFKDGAGVWGRSQALCKRVRHTGVRHGW